MWRPYPIPTPLRTSIVLLRLLCPMAALAALAVGIMAWLTGEHVWMVVNVVLLAGNLTMAWIQWRWFSL